MSIYPVHIASFHEGDQDKLELAESMIKCAYDSKCEECGGEVTIDNCWALHSLCYIGADVYCSAYCIYGLGTALLSENESTREWAKEMLKEIEGEEQ